MVRFSFIIAVLLGLLFSQAAPAAGLADIFLGKDCRTRDQPTLIVTDLTVTGEIDDSVSLLMYRELQRRRCIRVIGIVSIFGNGRSSTAAIHANLERRLHALGLDDWRELLLRGPDHTSFRPPGGADQERLVEIAAVINRHEQVVVAELGPLTVSASLLMHGMVEPRRIARILGVGGRVEGERFTTGRKLAGRLFAFRDMNIAEDTKAAAYLLRHHARKLWMVTYRSGIGARMVQPETIASYAPALEDHAFERARVLRDLLGYDGIPLWDTWTTSYFLKGGPEALGCRATLAAMRFDDGGFRDPMQLWIDRPPGKGRPITACH